MVQQNVASTSLSPQWEGGIYLGGQRLQLDTPQWYGDDHNGPSKPVVPLP